MVGWTRGKKKRKRMDGGLGLWIGRKGRKEKMEKKGGGEVMGWTWAWLEKKRKGRNNERRRRRRKGRGLGF